MRCSFFGEDFCVINGQELAKAKTDVLTIAVYCREYCEFELQAELTEELLLETGKSHKLYFLANQERVIRFSIPDDPNITTIEIQGINQNKYDKFNMILTQGNNLPSSENALYLRPAWENGYVGKFTEDCFCFCRGCNYTVLVSSQSEGYITLGAKVSGQVVDISSADGVVYDSVLNFHTQCYSFLVTNESQDLKIKLESYAGDPDVYVHPLILPPLLGFAAFNSRDHFQNEELILTPEERKRQNATTGLYFICVFGQQASTYKMTVKNENHDIYLHAGLSESGYVQPNTTNLYYFRDNILADPAVKLEMILHVMVGKARLKSKACPIKSNAKYEDFQNTCTYTAEELLAEDDPHEMIAQHMGSESEPVDSNICKLDSSDSKRGNQITCVYVIGIIGLAEFETHYSVMVKTNKEEEVQIMKEGSPIVGEMMEATPRFYNIKINDPDAVKLTIQLTTIHGDPDIFVSRTTKTPSYMDFEARSIRCGMYPEIIQFAKNPDDPRFKTLEADYYIAVFGYTQSTYSLVYFTESEAGVKSNIKLLTGQKQRGVMKSTNESMIYEFTLSNSVNEDVEIRVHSENGNFQMYLGQDFIPDTDNFTASGNEHMPIIFKQENVTELQKSKYYIRVQPYQLNIKEVNQSKDSAGMAYVHTIGFYEQGSFIQLSLGQPIRGQISNESFHYYYLDVAQNEQDFEFSLTTISGNPDLVISLDRTNKFPNRQFNDFISEIQFTADSIHITQDQIKLAEQKSGKKVQNIFIGVYTTDQERPATYTILATQKEGFNPIQLTNGQIQEGSLQSNEEKFYYYKTGSDMPIYSTLIPKQGNPDLSISVIKNFSESKYEWKKYAESPLFQSKVQFGADLIYLSSNDTIFKQACGSSCILLLKVTNQKPESEAHYSLSITRDILELVENNQIQDTIRDFGQYKYYRFYKSCEECDIDVTITPLQTSSNMLLMASFDVKNTLPTHQNNPKWSMNVFQQTTMKITPDDETKLKNKGIGYYTIGVHSHQNASYLLTVQTISTKESVKAAQIKKVYLGETHDLIFEGEETRYFYFENWNNATLNIQYLPKHQSANTKMQNGEFSIQVASLSELKQPPKSIDDLKSVLNSQQKSIAADDKTLTETIKIDYTSKSIDFCVQCYYLIVISNLQQNTKQVGSLIITQENEHGGLGFESNLIIGRPYILHITQQQQAQFNFILAEGTQINLDVQYYTGSATFQIKDWSDNSIFYPDNTFNDSSLMVATETKSTLNLVLKQLINGRTYQLIVTAISQDLHASLLLSQDSDLTLISDGQPHTINITSQSSQESRYFTYLPPSQKFQLGISAMSLGSSIDTIYSVHIKQISTKPSSGLRQLQQKIKDSNIDQNIEVKPKSQYSDILDSISPKGVQTHTSEVEQLMPKKSQLDEEVNQDLEMQAHFWQKYRSWKQFDYTFRSVDTKTGTSIYESIPIELEQEDNILLVKVDVIKGAYQKAEIKLTMSSSEVQVLIPGTTIRGHVSNWNQNMKIFEVYINQNHVFTDDSTDLFIQITPCNGRVDFYVSEDYFSLFDTKSSVQIQNEFMNGEKFGMQTARLKNIGGKEVVYVGVQSVNEFYKDFQDKVDSYFELKTQMIRGSQIDINEQYTFKDSIKEISVQYDETDDYYVVVNWSPIYRKNQEGQEFGASSFGPAQEVVYQIFAGTSNQAKSYMNSICSIEHASHHDISTIFTSYDDQRKTRVKLKRADIEKIRVIGVLARIKDPMTGELINLAYEPYLLNPDTFGVKISMRHLIAIAAIGLAFFFILGVLVCFLRKKSIRLQKRLEFEVSSVQQNFSQLEIQTSDRSDSREDI
eukprot:403361391